MLAEDKWRRLAPLPLKLVRMCISVLAPKKPGGGGMGHPEIAEPRDRLWAYEGHLHSG